MATDREFVDEVQAQSGLGRALSYKKMFGEYALYLHGKVVAFACDNQLYVKPTDAGRQMLGRVVEEAPYPGGKPHFRIDEPTEDRERLRRLLEITATALPLPKPKPRREAAAETKAEPRRPPKAASGTRTKKTPASTGAKPAAKPKRRTA